MHKIKVLQFTIGNVHGGVTQYVLKNWEFIDREKFHFDFATMSRKLDFADKLTAQGSKIHYLSCYAEVDREKFVEEVNQILNEKYDVIHLHTNFWRSFIVEELAIEHKVPKVIVHSHNSMVDILGEEARNEAIRIHHEQRQRFSPKLATDYWACSQLAADWLFGDNIPKDRIKILKNAIDIDQFSYNEDIRNEYRKKLGVENCFVMGHTGRFVYQKNHEMLIEVFHLVSQKNSHAKLMLIGGGTLEDSIREKVQQYGLEDKVLFMGKRNDVNNLLQAMDLFLLPSRFEGLPIVLIEAQASGIKCLTSTCVTHEAAITSNVEFLPLDLNVWVDKITHYSRHYDRVKVDHSITDAGYNIQLQIKELQRLYTEK